ncbi:hypothetical protein GJS30_08205 [Bacillus velezensis]|nr:hypothetical protein [Bacillus amyloliquefaciens]NRR85363.1 hypothetical protein [Bacillus velezensis]NRS10295.1 hypothetical protein [Bacillus velezensis]POI17037.1 hypothetical protein C2145_13310 [Bacillus velezensis]QLG07046.1 hypothetical protein GJS30_08205 [Bacillus velezensis]
MAPRGNLLSIEKVAETAQKVLKTREPGDGKILIFEVPNTINIRTGEEGPDTL